MVCACTSPLDWRWPKAVTQSPVLSELIDSLTRCVTVVVVATTTGTALALAGVSVKPLSVMALAVPEYRGVGGAAPARGVNEGRGRGLEPDPPAANPGGAQEPLLGGEKNVSETALTLPVESF